MGVVFVIQTHSQRLPACSEREKLDFAPILTQNYKYYETMKSNCIENST